MKKILLVIAFAFVGLSASVQAQNGSDYGFNLYLQGHELTEEGLTSSVFWHNGSIVPFPVSEDSGYVSDMCISNGNIYAVGQKVDQPALWINGVFQDLGVSGNYGGANGVYVANGEVYVCGYVGGIAGESIFVWANGVVTFLSTEGTTYGNSVYYVCASGDDVYAAGYANTNTGSFAALWVNGQPTLLSPEMYIANLCVDGGDVYAFGEIADDTILKPFYWHINSGISTVNPVIIATDEHIQGVRGYVANGNVYIVGGEDQSMSEEGVMPKAVLWTNGVKTYLADTTMASMVSDVVVANGNVYAAGIISTDISDNTAYNATLWVNGVAQTLWNGFADRVYAEQTNSLVNITANEVSLYPNPAKETLNIKSDNKIERVEIVNILGQNVCMTQVNSNNATINVADLAKGNYFAKLYTAKGVSVKKFVVE